MVKSAFKSFLTRTHAPTPEKLTYKGGTGPPKNATFVTPTNHMSWGSDYVVWSAGSECGNCSVDDSTPTISSFLSFAIPAEMIFYF